MNLNFVTVDVFTDRQFGGNPLAVIPDGRGLTSSQMQAIAAEFNLSETTFVLPPQHAAHTASVRIFTPRAELPFAGHPNVGTAFVLASAMSSAPGAARPFAGDTMTFDEKAGLVRIDLLRSGSEIVGARLAAPQALAVGETIAPAIIAAACGLGEGDVETRAHLPCIASCGTPFVFAELKSRDALAAARPRTDVFAEHIPVDRATGIHLYVQENGGIDARMFAPLYGVPEDPATGSANVALIGLLARIRPEPTLRLECRITQGVVMGRPSVLDAAADKRDGAVTATYIGGTCVPVMSGTIALA
jgi:trans-2,3-dihydro-3-hydroxyanthranilate isomerase